MICILVKTKKIGTIKKLIRVSFNYRLELNTLWFFFKPNFSFFLHNNIEFKMRTGSKKNKQRKRKKGKFHPSLGKLIPPEKKSPIWIFP